MPYYMIDVNIFPFIKLIQSPKSTQEVGDLSARATWSLTGHLDCFTCDCFCLEIFKYTYVEGLV